MAGHSMSEDRDLMDALATAVKESAPELAPTSAERVVHAVMGALDALGLLDELPPDFHEDD